MPGTRGLTRRAFFAGSAAACGIPSFSHAQGGSWAGAFEVKSYKFEDPPHTPQVAKLIVYSREPGFTYFAPHNDETTSADVGFNRVAEYGGTMIRLTHTGKRNMPMTHQGKRYFFDPNRMFTTQGIQKTLANPAINPSRPTTPALVAAVEKFAKYVVDELRLGALHKGTLIGLHNNTPGGYSARSYLPQGAEARNAAHVHLNPAHNPDDFFLVTVPELFLALKARGYNVVLQSLLPEDDGSMSVYCAKKRIPYVNVETLISHGAIQERMLKEVVDIIESV
jgi:hypothetical protein